MQRERNALLVYRDAVMHMEVQLDKSLSRTSSHLASAQSLDPSQYTGFSRWTVTQHPITEINAVPSKKPQSENFEPIGVLRKERPKYLYDSQKNITTEATDDIFQECCIYISYTWGSMRTGNLI